jgi:enoyl-CoA hydratase
MEIEYGNRVAILRLRAPRANAVDAAFVARLDELLDQLDLERARALVLTGNDRFFSAGLSFSTLREADRDQMRALIDDLSRLMLRLLSAPLPVLAAINGHAIAAGFALALVADVRVMVDAPVQVGLNEVQLGLGLPHVIAELVRERLPPTSWLHVALRGELFGPAEARELGLVDEVVPAERLEDWSIERATSLARISPVAYRQIKQALLAPTMKRLERLAVENDDWLDTWFSEGAQRRVREAADEMQRSIASG